MVSRNIDQFKLKQTQGSCIVFSYCLIMSHFTDKEPFEIMIDFVNDFKERSSNPTDLESAELYLSRECYGNNIVVINNAYMKRYHLRSFSNSEIKIEHLSLKNPDHIPIIKDKLKDENNDALLSASYEFVRQNNWHCTPIGCDSTGFYLIQTLSGLNDYEDIANLANFGSVTNIVNPGDCLLIYKEPTQG